MNIGNIAKLTGMPVKTIRYYADIDLVKPCERSTAGYRRYDEASINKLVFVRRAREFGFSIDECRELLGLYENKKRTSADVKKLAMTRLRDIERKQEELQALHEELSRFTEECPGDHLPNCPILDAFSEKS